MSRPAIVVVTIHAGDHSRAVFGPFNGEIEASRWGYANFPGNISASGHSVTWCWEYLVPPTSDISAEIEAAILE